MMKVGYFNFNTEKIDISLSLNFKINSHKTRSIYGYQRLLLSLIKVKLNERFYKSNVNKYSCVLIIADFAMKLKEISLFVEKV